MSPYKQNLKDMKSAKANKNMQFIQRTYGYRGNQVLTQSTEESQPHNNSVD